MLTFMPRINFSVKIPFFAVSLLIIISSALSCSNDHKKKKLPLDPLFKDQWHLQNTGQGGGIPGMDINVSSAWSRGYYGSGIKIAIVDDGLDYNHEDLKDNILTAYNYNYVTGNSIINSGSHGTCVAGVAAAVHNNVYGGMGAAPEANLFGYNLLVAYTAVNEHNAMIGNLNIIDVSNNSWGPADGTGQLIPSPITWQMGIDEGVTYGRNGKGIVYLWAAGNGGQSEVDNSNYDGYANYYGVTAICAVTDQGTRAWYSEKGANLWACTYSNGGSSGITTTDITGYGGYKTSSNYYNGFGGTSSASPLAAGIVALILDANPNLSWRDVKNILAGSAKKIDPTDSDWQTNGAGYHINHKYGFGAIDASAAVDLALTWTNLSAMKTATASLITLNQPIPENSSGITSTSTVTGTGITHIEYMTLAIDINHSYSGDLEISLKSPANTVSILSEEHICWDDSGINQATCTYFQGGNSFTFGTARNLEEAADGLWTLTVKDLASGDIGTTTSWHLTFYGR